MCSAILTKIFGSEMLYPVELFSESSDILEVDCVVGSLLMVKALPMIECGMYDEEFFLYCEEKVLGNKMKANGYKTIIVPKQSYIHKHSVSIKKSINSLYKRKELLLTSKYLYIKKYFGVKGIKLFFVWCIFKMLKVESLLLAIYKEKLKF